MNRFFNKTRKHSPKAQPKVSVPEMKAFLKKHDPFFANELSLSRLSLEEMVDYYQECVEALKPDYKDDWDWRVAHVIANNI